MSVPYGLEEGENTEDQYREGRLFLYNGNDERSVSEAGEPYRRVDT